MTVALRPLRREDGARVLAWRNSPAVAAFMYTDHAISEAEHARWLDAAVLGSDRRYWIVEVDGAPVGVANLARIDPVARRCDLGHYLAEPGLRGRGLGTAVDYILVRHVFETLQFNKLWSEVLSDNLGALRLHESFGFRREALFRDHVWKGGRFHDVAGVGLLAADWTTARPAVEAKLQCKGFDPRALILAGPA